MLIIVVWFAKFFSEGSGGRICYIIAAMCILETDRLFLRHFRDSDADAMNSVFGDPEVMRYGPGVQSEQWISSWIQKCLNSYAEHGFGLLATINKSTSDLVGYCGLYYFPNIEGQPEVEIGFRLARPFWQQGFATEAAVAVRDYGFNVLQLQRLVLVIDPQNTGSLRVAEKLGACYEKDVMLEGYTYPDHLYVLESAQ